MSLSRLQSLSDGDKWHSRTTGTLQASPLILTEVEQQTGKCMGFQHQQFIFSIKKTKPYIKTIHSSFLFKHLNSFLKMFQFDQPPHQQCTNKEN